MTRVFWPRMDGPTDRIGRRLGRVMFWIGASIAALFVGIGFVALSHADSSSLTGFSICLATAAPFYLGGRALCYVLGSE